MDVYGNMEFLNPEEANAVPRPVPGESTRLQ